MSASSDGPDAASSADVRARPPPVDDVAQLRRQLATLETTIRGHEQVEATLRHRDRQLRRLLDAALRLNSQRELDAVLQQVADSAREVIGCRYAALGVLDPELTRLENFVYSGLSAADEQRIGELPTGKGVLGLLIKERKPLRLSNLGSHPDAHGFPPDHPPMQSFLGVPVVGRDGPIGNLYFTEKDGGGKFTADDEAVAQMLAAEAAVAVENARFLSRLQALRASRERFYAMVNHELRNALTAVHGWAELMHRRSRPDPPRPVVETMEAAEHALEMLSDLIDLSRIEAKGLSIKLADVEAVEIARDALHNILPLAEQAGVVIQEAGFDQRVPFHTDPGRVRQILDNLLRNAVRHSGGQPVTLRVEIEPGLVRYNVIDRGEGIDDEQLEIIFDAYHRAESRAGGGTGLGLTLSRQLARLLGGDIEVRSELGAGSTFTLRLPRPEDH